MGLNLSLKGRMDDWGPWGGNEGDVVVFSIGNPNEGHGPALPRDNDSRCARFIAYNICERTGSRYVADIPYTTDRVGDIAKDWSPCYLPMDECVRKSKDFISWHLGILKSMEIPFTKLLVVMGHGGNKGIESYPDWTELKEEFQLEWVRFVPTINLQLGPVLERLEHVSDETREAYLSVKGGHADTMEHSIAALYGALDHGKLYKLNQTIKNDGLDTALKRWPVIGGLGGYIRFGGDRYEPLRDPRYGLVSCLEKLESDGQIHLFTDFAKILVETSIEATIRDIFDT